MSKDQHLLDYRDLSPGNLFFEAKLAVIKYAVEQCDGDAVAAAKILGCSHTTVYNNGFSKKAYKRGK